MIDDLRQLEDDSRLHADVCIVGAGPAGISLARRLAGAGRDVLLLESGGLELEPETDELNRGEVRGDRYFDLRLPRRRVLGGTSVHWTGHMALFTARDFAHREWVASPGWPIAFDEVDRFYPEALSICGGEPWPRQRMPGLADYGRSSLPPGGASWLELRYRQQSASGARRFGVHFREELRQSTSIRVVLHANVTELIAAENGDRILAVRARTLEGRRSTVSARAYVLACGGLDNPRLLLASNRVVPAGIGNDRDLVGRFFQEHPAADVGEVFGLSSQLSRLDRRQTGSPILLCDLCPSPELLRRERCLEFGLFYYPQQERSWSFASSRQYRATPFLTNAARLFVATTKENGASGGGGEESRVHLRRGDLTVMQEMEPDPSNRVTLADDRDALGVRRLVLHVRLGASDRRTMAVAARAAVRELGRFSVGRVGWNGTALAALSGDGFEWHGVAHHIGTTRMADDPARGVVDRNCRVHGVDNLWIAGSSVFPSSGYVNPTVTIVALALRLAEHLEGRLA